MNLKEQALDLVAKMTLEEEAALCVGKNFWESAGVERLGLKSQMLTDGPHGLRKQVGSSDHLGINKSVPATSFPTAATTACSFDRKLLRQMGESLGEKCQRENVGVILGPGVNMKRSPLCGRNFEYFSEDPFLAGELAASLVSGVQSRGVGTSLKHFAANNQETNRMANDSVVDERAFREIYLSAFERVVKKAQPWTVMSSYNKINGIYASDNKKLLTEILRNEWGFEGLVVSDWGGTNDRVKALKAGMDLEMPNSGCINAKRLVNAVKNGTLSKAELDECATRVTELLLKIEASKATSNRTEEDDNRLAKEIAIGSMVLLKNDGILPLKKVEKIAFIGQMAKYPRYQGAGSSKINPSFLDNAVDVAENAGIKVIFAPGYSSDSTNVDETLISEAVKIASEVDKVVIFAGLPDSYESEGFDRDNLDMPQAHNLLIEECSKVNKNIVVVLQGGSPFTMPWKNDVKGILLAYLAGQAGCSATVDLLFGKENPSGKLAETWPLSLEKTPTSLEYPGTKKTVEYRESIFIGYRFYDKAKCEIAYPFGYGLSYTKFEYSNARVTKAKASNSFDVSVDVTNCGSMNGKEIVELYIGKKDSKIIRCEKELKGFEKVFIKAGETQTVTISLHAEDFRYFNLKANMFCIEDGKYELYFGSSSVKLMQALEVTVSGDEQDKLLEKDTFALNDYRNIKVPFKPSDSQFEILLGRKLPPCERDPKEPFSPESTLEDIKDTFFGKIMIKAINNEMQKMIGAGDKKDTEVERMGKAMIMSMPLRSMPMSGSLNHNQVDGLVDAANGHLIRGIFKLIRK